MPEDHIVYTNRLEIMLKKEFEKEATPEFLSLVRVAIAAHECAFQKYVFPGEDKPLTKERYLKEVGEVWDATEDITTLIKPSVKFRSNTPLIDSAFATLKHASQKYGITKEKYLEWVNEAWDAGIHQRKIYNMEIEGCINNSMGVALNFGASLALWGRGKGYIKSQNESFHRKRKQK